MLRRCAYIASASIVPFCYSVCGARSDGNEQKPVQKHGILFLGSGSSSGVPLACDLMRPDKTSDIVRAINAKAAEGDPRLNKNYRCNPSLMLRFDDKNVIIDVGKTFRESIIRWFPVNQVRSVDGIILTHPHADAIYGLDDVRTLQFRDSPPMQVYLSDECFSVVSERFPYLLPAPVVDGAVRKVAAINFCTIQEYKAFDVCGLSVLPIPVMHGEDMKCMGYIFGRNERVCYLSDISRMLPETLLEIQRGDIDLLIVDDTSSFPLLPRASD
jgi:phosphoribosyl 1,2-cyclic phosphodiesterase